MIPETISAITNAVLGSMTAPSFGLFIVAFFFRKYVNQVGVITGFITPILPIVLFFIGQNIKVRKLVPPEFKMITSRDTAACPENSHHFLPLNATDLPSTSKKYPLLVRLLTLSPHFVGILSLILFFIVVFTVSILTSKRKKLENR